MASVSTLSIDTLIFRHKDSMYFFIYHLCVILFLFHSLSENNYQYRDPLHDDKNNIESH